MCEYIIVPLSEVDALREKVFNLPEEEQKNIYNNFKLLVVEDKFYKKIADAYFGGELKEVLKGGAPALEHWCKLGNNTIIDDTRSVM
jgi:hypothetical protein